MIDLVALSEPGSDSWIQIMKTGEFNHPQFGKLKINPQDLHQFKENFDKKVRGVDLAVDVSHEPDKGAVAWFKELKVDGDKLMAKVQWTEEGEQLVKSGKYRYFSPEFMFNYKDASTGKQFKDVLFGGAITNRPFLKNMDPIELSEDDSYGTVWLSEDDTPKSDVYDPDGDGDDDSTTDPKKNPDWMMDVMCGNTPWPSDPAQQAKLEKAGATKALCDAACKAKCAELQKKGIKLPATMKMAEPKPSAQDQAKQAQMARCKACGIQPKEGGAVTKPSEYADIPDSDFADPTNYAYPIDKAHVMAAYRYFAKPTNQAKYSPEERAIIAKKIVAALPDNVKAEASKTFKLDENPDAKVEGNAGEEPSPAGPIDDKNAGQFGEPSKKTKGGKVKMTETVSLSEYNAMQERVKTLEEQNRRVKFDEKVKSFMFNENTKKGKILPAQHDKVLEMMMGMSDDQVAKFEEVINALPDAIAFGEETGFGVTGNKKDRDTLVAEKADLLMSEGKTDDYKKAILMAEKEIPESIQ
jgi:phage I-like protein